jgi:CTP:molybdopterin cytidylyltransferase MocA
MNSLTAIITAAGASSRMAEYGHKALLRWCGKPLIAHQVETLVGAGFDQVVVVTGAEANVVSEATPDEARVVYHADWSSGRSGSIEAGAEVLPNDVRAVLVVAVDQPLSSDVLQQLVPAAGAPVVQPVDEEHGAGHPVILGGEHLGALRNLKEEPEGLRSLVRRLRPSGEMVSVDGLPHWDLNTPDDYERARATFRDANSD